MSASSGAASSHVISGKNMTHPGSNYVIVSSNTLLLSSLYFIALHKIVLFTLLHQLTTFHLILMYVFGADECCAIVQAPEALSSTANGMPPEDDMHLQQLEAIRVKIRVSLSSQCSTTSTPPPPPHIHLWRVPTTSSYVSCCSCDTVSATFVFFDSL